MRDFRAAPPPPQEPPPPDFVVGQRYTVRFSHTFRELYHRLACYVQFQGHQEVDIIYPTSIQQDGQPVTKPVINDVYTFDGLRTGTLRRIFDEFLSGLATDRTLYYVADNTGQEIFIPEQGEPYTVGLRPGCIQVHALDGHYIQFRCVRENGELSNVIIRPRNHVVKEALFCPQWLAAPC